ncbi:hypothetical protein [Streptomyces sp. ISL-12]|uniref:hypothetical protein n=1 Tax=Streptomyces sp. ISL-12 TaxID=2819177 RepID=UPI0027DEF723|nr:hypothetical protein [Streptomyces sp. ISL-12]
MFVDNSGRRAKLLRRLGILVGVVCMGYAVVLGLAFMGIGTSINPSSLLPFGGGGNASAPGGGMQPQGGVAPTGMPSGAPSGVPSGAPTGVPPTGAAIGSASATATASAPAASATAD